MHPALCNTPLLYHNSTEYMQSTEQQAKKIDHEVAWSSSGIIMGKYIQMWNWK